MVNQPPKTQDSRFAPPSEETSRQLRALMEILRIFRDLSPTLPVNYVHALLAVAMKPGGGSTDYMTELGVVQPVMSRMMLAMGKKSRSGDEGLGLIDDSADPIDLRRKRTYLTPKGRQLLNKVIRELERI